jgi:hypothetical protein
MRTAGEATQAAASAGDGLTRMMLTRPEAADFDTGDEGELVRPDFLPKEATWELAVRRDRLRLFQEGLGTSEMREAARLGARAVGKILESGSVAGAQLMRVLFTELQRSMSDRTPGQLAAATMLGSFAFLEKGGFASPATGGVNAALIGTAALGGMGVSEMILEVIDYIYGIERDPSHRGSLLDFAMGELLSKLGNVGEYILGQQPRRRGGPGVKAGA